MTSIKHKSSLNAARELCINEKMVSSDMNAIAHERSRLIIITFATTMLWVVMALIVDHTNTKQAFCPQLDSTLLQALWRWCF